MDLIINTLQSINLNSNQNERLRISETGRFNPWNNTPKHFLFKKAQHY